MCNKTITVFNARLDAATGDETYDSAIISGVSWHATQAETIDPKGGLIMANKVIVRIPLTATVADGRRYVDPVQYGKPLPIVDTFVCNALPVGFDFGVFTLTGGTVIVRGSVTGGGWTPSALRKAYADCFTVLGVTDNRRAPNAPHFKVVGA